jgi:hypothetical protein
MTASSSLARPRTFSRRNPLGRYDPKVISEPAHWRFIRSRREGYLREVDEEPTEYQAALIDQMIEVEWQAFACKYRASSNTDERIVTRQLELFAEFSRQLMVLRRDFTKAKARPPSLPKAKPGPPQLDLEAHMAKLRQREAAP